MHQIVCKERILSVFRYKQTSFAQQSYNSVIVYISNSIHFCLSLDCPRKEDT